MTKSSSATALEQKIRQLRADIDVLIDARAQAVARESPGVPVGVIRNMLTARAPACPCAQYIELFADAQKIT